MSQTENRLKKIRNHLHRAMRSDRPAIIRELRYFEGRSRQSPGGEEALERIEKRLENSIRRTEKRRKDCPRISCPPSLPITAHKDEIVAAIRSHRVIIVTGETGSGKTTQLPKLCLEAGRGTFGYIGCTQPRRIAAVTVAQRISEEMGDTVGNTVGYKIRFEEKLNRHSYIKIMTDGILLMEIQADPFLSGYDTLIVDEAHERSLNIDFVLGMLKMLLARRRDLKVIITSATIDTEKFSRAFDHAPIIEVSGRLYPVEVRYVPLDPDSEEAGEMGYVEAAVSAVDDLDRRHEAGDILVFMPTERDIRETCDLLEGRNYRDATIYPLYARLSSAEQRRVFRPVHGRKIIVATNVAETSITIPGIRYVIDTGLARIARYNPRTRASGLPIEPISQSSADQRKGRCGRVQNGICIRLYSQEDYEERPLFTPPEILRSNLAEVVLRMLALKIGDISIFPFIDPPGPRNIKAGFDMLEELGAIERKEDEGSGSSHYVLTSRGEVMARMPLDPRIYRMIIEAEKEGCVDDVAIIAASLSTQDPRERPYEQEKEAELAHGIFVHPASDFITLQSIWNRYHEALAALKTQGQMRKFCRQHFLSYKRMREWQDIHDQIREIIAEEGIRAKKERAKKKEAEDFPALYGKIHRSILSGYLSNIAMKKEKNFYATGGGKQAMIFPGSGLFNRGGNWIVAAEFLETTRLFARTAANIENDWLESLGGPLCRYTYSNPHWNRKRGEVVALEQVTLYGLPIVSGRTASYGKINPADASIIFIQSALVKGDLDRPFPFLIHNRHVIEKVLAMENKIRRRNLLADEDTLVRFYEERLGDICDVRSLQKLIRERGSDGFLRMKTEDVLQLIPDEEELSLYPNAWPFGKKSLPLTYRFDPGKSDDGVTVRVPVNLLPALPEEVLDWGVPGLLKEKISVLLKGLPKTYRIRLSPIGQTLESILEEIEWGKGSLAQALSGILREKFNTDIPPASWSSVTIPDHLKMRLDILDSNKKTVASGRDIGLLKEQTSHGEETSAIVEVRRKWERDGITTWDFDELPSQLEMEDDGGLLAILHPALVKAEGGVGLRLFKDKKEAEDYHVRGVIALFEEHFRKELRYLKKHLSLPGEMKKWAVYFGGERFFEEGLYREVLRRLFGLPMRSRKSFLKHAEETAPAILPSAQALLLEIKPVLETYFQTRQALHRLENSAPPGRNLKDFFSDIRTHLDRLMPDNFLEVHPRERWSDLVRYLKALSLRAEKGLLNQEKDRERAEEIRGFDDRLKDLRKSLSSSTSDEKREKINEWAWMIEEYRLSLFTQELKTAYPVSRKRLVTKFREIEEML
ncbi:MAG: ATP-dependent RNA helicase HrpA [Deltaproteobacteria bacterium]|nr:ATP-dependent RNA helicase HrpA [Deltaproteobacteria bacterium]